MKRFVLNLVIVVFSLFVFVSLSMAAMEHGGMKMGGEMKMDTKEVLVEGVKVVFQIMANGEHQKTLKDM